MTRIGIALAFAILLSSVTMNLLFGFTLGSNTELLALSSSTVWQLLGISLAIIVEFGAALIILVFILPSEKMPELKMPSLPKMPVLNSLKKKL